MEQLKMLLLDFDPEDSLGHMLRGILESSFSPEIASVIKPEKGLFLTLEKR